MLGGKRSGSLGAFAVALLAGLLDPSSVCYAQVSGVSEQVTWTCADTPCPWGYSDYGEAIVWPATDEPISTRLGYSVSGGIYLPADHANGITVSVDSGSANAYAGLPDAESHDYLGTISPGSPLEIVGLEPGEVLSIQSGGTFTYSVAPPDGSAPEPEPPADVEDGNASSLWVVWSCTGSPCPWGSPLGGEALVWPEGALDGRLGYTVSDSIYLPAGLANGLTVWLSSGAATAYAGLPDADSHRVLGNITPAEPLQVSGLGADEVLSVQSSSSFEYGLIFNPQDPADPPDQTGVPASTSVTWNCTSSPCPWGPSLDAEAIVWSSEDSPSSSRLGYTSSDPIYLPAASANGITIAIESGSATAYAGLPGADFHRSLAAIAPGSPYLVTGLGAGEVLSVQDSAPFTFEVTVADPADPGDPDPIDPGGDAEPTSEWVTWTCTDGACPWGPSLSGDAIVWPAEDAPLATRLGYTVSEGIYLPAATANGMTVSITSGAATLYVGSPGAASHRVLATLFSGDSYQVSGVEAGEVLSVQSSGTFTYAITPGDPTEPPDPADPGEPDGVIHSVPGVWQCNAPDCSSANWYTELIPWPSWAAYNDNARSGQNAKAVFSPDGEPLYPYMGSWADGCEVTAQSGTVLVIEWERGTDVWRETWLAPGETHTIDLQWPEDGAMLESFDFSPGFSVTLQNCEAQPLP